MNVTFTRNGTQHHVTPQVAGELMSNMVAALCDARDGVDLAKSPSYLKFQSLMSEHVYRQRAAVRRPLPSDGGKSFFDSQNLVRVPRQLMMWFDESSTIKPVAWTELTNSMKAMTDELAKRRTEPENRTKIQDCRRAYNAMVLNMYPRDAIVRLSERFGVATSVIKEWIR